MPSAKEFFSRQGAAYRNQLVQACGSLMGIAAGLLADRVLNDSEVRFLRDWLSANEMIAAEWPGDVLFGTLQEVLADDHVSEEERAHLVQMLTKIVGGNLERAAQAGVINALAFDEVGAIDFAGGVFCVTGEFVYGPRTKVIAETEARGGLVKNSVGKNTDYLLVGLAGSDEWKWGSHGTKIARAMALKREGCEVLIVPEDAWRNAVAAAPTVFRPQG